MVHQGEVSRARQLLTSSGLAPGNAETLAELTDPARRPAQLNKAIPAEVLGFEPPERLKLDKDKLYEALSTARKGKAADLSGTRLEHLRVLLDSGHWDSFYRLAAAFARGELQQEATKALKLGRMTALKKNDGRGS